MKRTPIPSRNSLDRKSINTQTLKSSLYAGCVASALTFLCLLLMPMHTQRLPAQATAPPVLASTPAAQQPPIDIDRFRIFYSPNVRADTYLVDTKTGNVWQEQGGKNGETVFNAVPVTPAPELVPAQ